MKIGVIGTGYVGLIQSVGLSEFGYNVVGIDIDETKVKLLNNGDSPLYEEGLDELLKKNINKNLKFTTDYNKIKNCNVIFLCVGTPQDENGHADLKYIYSATESIKQHIDKEDYKIIVLKSTVPIGTNRKIKEHLKGYNVDVVSNPEFLREGIAVSDFFNPERIVLGFEDINNEKPINILKEIYSNFNEKSQIIITNWESAEMIKYASNAFLATKISFANELAKLSDKVGGDIQTVCKAMGIDSRIGPKFLNAGIGYGGSCFHPDETLFVDFGNRIKCLTFKELFSKLNENNCPVKILSANNNLKLELVNLKMITVRDYSDNLIILKTTLGRDLKITKDHPVVVLKNNKLIIKLAEQLNENDNIILPHGDFGENKTNEIDILNEIKKNIIEKTYINNEHKVLNEFNSIKSYSDKYIYSLKRSRTLKSKNTTHIKNMLNKHNYNSIKLITSKNKSAITHYKIKINNDFSKLISYYLTKGQILEDFKINGDNKKRICFYYNTYEKEYINNTKNILEKLNINYIEKIKDNSHNIIISSNILSYIFEEILQCGTNCQNKQIPSQIFNSTEDIKWEFLKGLFMGDRRIVKLNNIDNNNNSNNNNNNNLNIEYRTVSKKLANSLMILLQSLGIVSSLKKCLNKNNILTYIIKIDRLNNIEAIKYNNNNNNNNNSILKIKSVKKEHYNGEVYSVETENNLVVSSYGLLVHNCFPKDVKALIKQFENNNISPKLIKATDEVNEQQINWFFNKIKKQYNNNLNNKSFAILGLAFKPDTDDIRESRAIKLIDLLLDSGASVKAFDFVEKARENTINNYKYNKPKIHYGYNLYVFEDIYKTIKNVNGIIITTEYSQFNNENWEEISNLVNDKIIFDGRNILNSEKLKKLGFKYYGVGKR